MHPILRWSLYLSLIIFVGFVAIRPYNWFCKISTKCTEINIADLMPSVEGNQPIRAAMEARNYRADIEFEVIDPKMINTVSGRKNTVTYSVKNLSDHTVKFRPEFSVEPKEFKEYVARQECLCFREYSLAKGESMVIPASFKFKSAIDEELTKKKIDLIQIIYTAKK